MMNHNPDQKCENCLCFQFKAAARDNSGFCKLKPPQRVDKGQSSYPTVTPDEWCAQWKAAVTAAKRVPA